MSNPHLQPTDYSVLKHVINIPKTMHIQVHPCELSLQGGEMAKPILKITKQKYHRIF